MSDAAEARASIERLAALVGRWGGTGRGQFPTIDAFAYRERLAFDWNECEPLLHFEQRTWRSDHGQPETPLHWESGFVIAREGGRYELINSQNGGRTEVMEGELATVNGGGLRLAFASRHLTNDDRLLATRREIVCEGSGLQYRVFMATRRVPELVLHLEASLQRIGGVDEDASRRP